MLSLAKKCIIIYPASVTHFSNFIKRNISEHDTCLIQNMHKFKFYWPHIQSGKIITTLKSNHMIFLTLILLWYQIQSYLSETEEETDATTQLESIVYCSLQLFHATLTMTSTFIVTTTTGSLQHHNCFRESLLLQKAKLKNPVCLLQARVLQTFCCYATNRKHTFIDQSHNLTSGMLHWHCTQTGWGGVGSKPTAVRIFYFYCFEHYVIECYHYCYYFFYCCCCCCCCCCGGSCSSSSCSHTSGGCGSGIGSILGVVINRNCITTQSLIIKVHFKAITLFS